MSPTLTLTNEHGYVALSIVSTVIVTTIQGNMVGHFRKKAGIPYPQFYATKEEAASNPNARKFNCAQRAHGNTLEALNNIVVLTLLAGIQYPVLAAVACGMWSAARLMYAINYVSGDPARRHNRGAFVHHWSGLILIGASTWSAIQLLTGKW